MIRDPQKSTLFPTTTLSRLGRPVPLLLRGQGGQPAGPLPVAAPEERGVVEGRLHAQQRGEEGNAPRQDRKSTRLNSSHANISYAVFCLKKKNITLPASLSQT